MGTAAMRELKIHQSTPATNDRGRLLTATEVAELVCDGRFSARWIIDRMGPTIGTKPGREWLFYKVEARQWWTRFLDKKRARS